jgi:hypothetical protein
MQWADGRPLNPSFRHFDRSPNVLKNERTLLRNPNLGHLARCSIPPVEDRDLKTHSQSMGARLLWSTENEGSVQAGEIERKNTAQNWSFMYLFCALQHEKSVVRIPSTRSPTHRNDGLAGRRLRSPFFYGGRAANEPAKCDGLAVRRTFSLPRGNVAGVVFKTKAADSWLSAQPRSARMPRERRDASL